ncbi:MAG: COX15/CtaA family protein [Microbacteriaceae bacterium]|nr:COX15/CtaA family protein [Microbacteriaceae bacterium]
MTGSQKAVAKAARHGDFAAGSAPVWPPAGKDARRYKLLRIFAIASLIANITIIATGGAVRLTGSGLGCPNWPLCTPESLVPTQALSWHSAIEFGNRMMTGVLSIIAVAVLVLLWNWRRQRPDLTALAFIVLGGIIAQAVVGGFTVWTGLNPVIVGFHYIASLILVAVTTVFVVRMNRPLAPRKLHVPAGFASLSHLVSALMAVTILVGVITTANGPHSGDKDVQRHGADASVLSHFHSWPGYALLAFLVLLAVWAFAAKVAHRATVALLLVTVLVQIAVGVYQARAGLPPLAVGVHMVIAAVAVSLMTRTLLLNKTHSPAAVASK